MLLHLINIDSELNINITYICKHANTNIHTVLQTYKHSFVPNEDYAENPFRMFYRAAIEIDFSGAMGGMSSCIVAT